MYSSLLVNFLLLTSTALATLNDGRSPSAFQHMKRKRSFAPPERRQAPRSGQQTKNFLTNKTQKFVVDGDNFPYIPFPIGESYAGNLPISATNSTNELFFWFWPSTNPLASGEIVLWLNGGPGCSSMAGLLEENGPVLWQPGTSAPNLNPYSWNNLTNVIWVDQPAGTGLSQGFKEYADETELAGDFLEFWKNFIDTFDLHGSKVYLTGESYAGMYLPYIGAAMLEANDKTYFDVVGMELVDPVIGSGYVQELVTAVPFIDTYQEILRLNDTTMARLHADHKSCGFADYLDKYFTFPPPGPFPIAPLNEDIPTGCDTYDNGAVAATWVNPCFDIYFIGSYCPFLPSLLDYGVLAASPLNFFNDSSVQAALNVNPPVSYEQCGEYDVFPNGDASLPPSISGALAYVIEKTNNVIIVNGNWDYLLNSNGTLLAIQNMTWNGLQGFQTSPFEDKLFAPYHYGPSALDLSGGYADPPVVNVAGAGFLGTTHTERGLTFSTVDRAGHEVPLYAPGVSYRQLEFLLGRIKSLTQQGDFTTQDGNYTGEGYWY